MAKNKNFFNLKGKVVVITGACGLLGRNHVFAVASAGAYPILIDIDQKKLKKLQGEVIKKFEVDILYTPISKVYNANKATINSG